MSAVTETPAAGAHAVAEHAPRNFEIRPKPGASGESDGELLEVSMGPHHPSTHGVFRMDVVLDGEIEIGRAHV